MSIVRLGENHKSDDEIVVTGVDGTSDWYVMPQGTQTTLVELRPDVASTAKIETSLYRGADPTVGPSTGVEWPDGDVTVATQNAIYGGCLVRCVVSAGTATMILKGIRS